MEIGFVEGGGDVEPKLECLVDRSKSAFFLFCFYIFGFFRTPLEIGFRLSSERAPEQLYFHSLHDTFL